MRYALLAVLLCGCAHQKTRDEVKTYLTPDCTRLKAECEFKNGKMSKDCKFDVACYKVVHTEVRK